MIESILLGTLGIPAMLVGMFLWGACAVALLDAVSAYRGSDRIDKLMRRRWK